MRSGRWRDDRHQETRWLNDRPDVMKLLALQQAKIRLSRARKAVTALKLRPISFADAQEAWVDFLLAANSVYFKLQRGVKKKSANKTWLKGVEDLRETDELLRYIHHARNSEEHGIERSGEIPAGSQ